MSYLRAKSRAINRNVYFDNRLNTFTKPPMKDGNLFVENDETIGGNLSIGGSITPTKKKNETKYIYDLYIL